MTHTNAQKLEILNVFRAAEGKPAIVAWKATRHQPMLDAYRAAQEAKQDEQFEASDAELAAQTIRPANEEPEVVVTPAPKVEEVAAPAPVATPAAKPSKAAKTPAVEKNGIKAPRAGGLCAQAWAMFDELGTSVDIKTALAEGAKRGFNDNNIRTEICRWRKFNGIAARPKKG
jgi:hypothetical protein